MLAALRGSGSLIVTVCAVVSLAILIVLGNWQWQRKAWKEDLIAQLEANAVAKPEPIADVQQGSTDSGADALRFRRVVLKGELRNDLEMHYWQPTNRGPGWSIIVPLVLERPFTWQGEPDKLVKAVLVDRGVVVEAD
ncbi:MAG: SURF1 family cytochrome oxidase biogenesis protein, partial [Pseudomonadota bacterium]